MLKKIVIILCCFFIIQNQLSAFADSKEQRYEIQLHDPEFVKSIGEKLFFNKNDYALLKNYQMILGYGIRNSFGSNVNYKDIYFFEVWSPGRQNRFLVASNASGHATLLPGYDSMDFFKKYNTILKKHPLVTNLYNSEENVKEYLSFIWNMNHLIVCDRINIPLFYSPKDRKLSFKLGSYRKLDVENVTPDEFNRINKNLKKAVIVFHPKAVGKVNNSGKPCGFLVYDFTGWGSGLKEIVRIKLKVNYTGEIFIKERQTVFSFGKHHRMVDK
jgi:hypothetical protein